MREYPSWLQETFGAYRDEVAELERQLFLDDVNSTTMAGYLTSGSTSHVFLLDDQHTVAKLPWAYDQTPQAACYDVLGYVRALVRGIGHSGLEQIVAYSPAQPSAVLSEYVNGLELECQLYDGSIADVPFAHYVDLAKTFQAMHARRISLDASNKNVLHTAEGFKVIDYQAEQEHPLRPIVAFASEDMLTSYYGQYREPGEPLPQYALAYREACGQVAGRAAVAAIDEHWKRQGFRF